MQDVETASGIHLDDVRLTLGGNEFHFDCHLPGGQTTAVTGPSGSGKSTLLNLISGFETPDSGRIFHGERDITDLHPAERPVSLVFQDNNLFAHLDIFTNVGLGINPSLRLTGPDRQAVSNALARVGLEGMEKRMPATLSGGERQRAAFARTMVRQRPVLLMDEPFAALDPGLRQAMAAIFAELHQASRNTVLIVTHDPDEVSRLAANVIFIEDGTIALQAKTEDFLSRSDIPAIAEFLRG